MKTLVAIVIALLLGSLSIDCAGSPQAAIRDKAILVTGATSGLGAEIATTLAEHGFFVYAGARRQEDIARLSRNKNMMGIRLDVTKQSDINAAVDKIRVEGRGLFGLVNNAGVFLYDPLIELEEQDLQFIMDVNVFGPYRVTRAFAPMIMESRGRITTTGSIAGISAGALMGPYSMSKFAIEAFTDALNGEMAKFNVPVSVIEPGNFRSDIMKNMAKRYEYVSKDRSQSLFSDELSRFSQFTQQDRSMHRTPEPVAAAVLDFMTSEKPKRRYMVAPNQDEARFTIERAMYRVIELNHDHDFSFSARELRNMLKQAQNAIQ